MGLQSFKNPNSDEARQHLLDRRCERKHPKRHRTKKRSVKQRAARKAKSLARAAVKQQERRSFHAKALAYWSGVADGHPSNT